MNYNLHPIFVHFPIALLLLYSFLLFFPKSKKYPQLDLRLTRLIVLIAGLLGAWLASSTGETAAHLARPNRAILNLHETFANTSSWFYVLLLIGELSAILPLDWLKYLKLSFLRPLWSLIVKIFHPRWLMIVLSVLGALAIAITGLLGGIMVYGTTADPLAAPFLKLFGL